MDVDSALLEWPERGLNLAALKEREWQPFPFNQFILKIHSRCNLACDYCYMYELADQSWRHQPLIMSDDIVRAVAARISEYARRHRLPVVQVALHGGEPLLAGVSRIDFIAREMRAAIGPDVQLELGIQTNGTRLSTRALEVFLAHGIRVGVSLDGGQEANDRHRLHRSGRGSYEEAARGITRLTEDRYRHLFSGLLAVIDLHNDPIETFESLAQFSPPAIDFLLPHGTWTTPPPGKLDGIVDTRYADWLISAFDYWYALGSNRLQVRLFRSVIRMLIGMTALSEQIGLEPARFLVIEADGSIEQVDSLKAAYDGAPETGLRIEDGFDEVAWHPGAVARQIGVDALCQTCRDCRIRDICGGGMYPHRYRAGSGFLNPSVYCPDLMKFIDHAAYRVARDLAETRKG